MLETLTAKQLSEWEAYDTLDPIGESRADIRMGILAATITNMIKAAAGSKSKKNIKPEDFIPKWGEEKGKPKQSVDQMRDLLMGMASGRKNKPDKK